MIFGAVLKAEIINQYLVQYDFDRYEKVQKVFMLLQVLCLFLFRMKMLNFF